MKLLVVGSVHGNEHAGRAVVARLRRSKPPRGTALWLIEDLNPDGPPRAPARTRTVSTSTATSPTAGRRTGGPFDTYHSGASAGSEPETQALERFVERVRPRVTLWYHQALRIVVRSQGDPKLERLYSRRSGLPRRALARTTAPPPAGRTTASRATRPSWSSCTAARPRPPTPRGTPGRRWRSPGPSPRSRVVERPIPFGAARKDEMRGYARRHYGIDDYRLRKPRVIVEHYTATSSFAPVFNTFASDAPDVELGELPGVCAHYVIDRDGTVYGLVPTTMMCRHTVGLNWTAIGIEHVGTSDGQVLGNRRQLRASLRLTRRLQGRYRIKTRNVIGHAESLSSPFHRERVARLRSQTHGDMARASMDGYRRLLGRLPAPASMR